MKHFEWIGNRYEALLAIVFWLMAIFEVKPSNTYYFDLTMVFVLLGVASIKNEIKMLDISIDDLKKQ